MAKRYGDTDDDWFWADQERDRRRDDAADKKWLIEKGYETEEPDSFFDESDDWGL